MQHWLDTTLISFRNLKFKARRVTTPEGGLTGRVTALRPPFPYCKAALFGALECAQLQQEIETELDWEASHFVDQREEGVHPRTLGLTDIGKLRHLPALKKLLPQGPRAWSLNLRGTTCPVPLFPCARCSFGWRPRSMLRRAYAQGLRAEKLFCVQLWPKPSVFGFKDECGRSAAIFSAGRVNVAY
jgi:hypothetical protein